MSPTPPRSEQIYDRVFRALDEMGATPSEVFSVVVDMAKALNRTTGVPIAKLASDLAAAAGEDAMEIQAHAGSIMVCEDVILEHQKTTLRRLHDHVVVPRVPYVASDLYVYCRIDQAYGPFTLSVRMISPTGQVTMIREEMLTPGPEKIVYSNGCLDGLTFEESGEYLFGVYADGVAIATHRYTVTSVAPGAATYA